MKPRTIIREISRHPALAVTLELAAGLVISLGALWAFAGLSEEVFEGETDRLDTALLLWIHSTSPGWLDAPLRLVTALGYPRIVVPLLLLAAYAFYRKGLDLSATLLLVSVPGAAILGTALKSLYGRARPELFDSGYEAPFFSFPSGHAITAVSFYGVLTLLTARRLRGRGRWSLVTAGAVLILLIGFSRLYLGVHYPSDVLAGYLVAALWVGTVGMALTLWRSLRDVRRRN